MYFDVDRINDEDDQLPSVDHRFLTDGYKRYIGERQGHEEFVSGTAANVILRELCASSSVSLRQERYCGPSTLYFLDGTGPASSPLIVLGASWESWYGILGLALRGAESRKLRAQEADAFRRIPSTLDRAEVASQSMPDAAERSRVLQLVEDIRAIHATSEAVDYSWEAQSTAARTELRAAWFKIHDRWESTFLDDDVDDPEGVGDMLEAVLEDVSLDETEVFDIAIASWDDGMAWGALPSVQQVGIAMAVVEERFEPTSVLACLLMQQHSGTVAEVKSLIALSDMPRLVRREGL